MCLGMLSCIAVAMFRYAWLTKELGMVVKEIKCNLQGHFVRFFFFVNDRVNHKFCLLCFPFFLSPTLAPFVTVLMAELSQVLGLQA